MYSYQDQLTLIKDIRVRDGQTFRGNCPFCHGRNTFTLSRDGNAKVWNCYRASCGITGSYGTGKSLSGLKELLNPQEKHIEEWVPPLFPIETNKAALKWLDSVHALEAYRSGLADIRYAPSEDRVMFSAGKGWTGRARKGVKPKWRKYGDTTSLMRVGAGPTAIVVEDAPSACAVGVLPSYTGVSLLGTQLTTQHVLELSEFKRVLFCLDPDAVTKSLAMSHRLNGYVPSSVRIIPNDLKFFTPTEIEEILSA